MEIIASKDIETQEQLLEELRQAGLDAYNVKDYSKAMEWNNRAAQQGNAQGQAQIGYLYQNGLGVTQNLDEAGQIMNDLNFAVERMPLDFEDHHFNITITVGVEETDFHSTLEELLDSADEKLYLGKNSGRNRVVV